MTLDHFHFLATYAKHQETEAKQTTHIMCPSHGGPITLQNRYNYRHQLNLWRVSKVCSYLNEVNTSWICFCSCECIWSLRLYQILEVLTWIKVNRIQYQAASQTSTVYQFKPHIKFVCVSLNHLNVFFHIISLFFSFRKVIFPKLQLLKFNLDKWIISFTKKWRVVYAGYKSKVSAFHCTCCLLNWTWQVT